MDEPFAAPRSRRALLAAAAGGAAALAASAAMPLSMAAHDADDVQLGAANASTATTSIADATADSDAFAASAVGTGVGVSGTSTGGAGVWAWSISAPPGWEPGFGSYTGVYGFSPASPTTDTVGVGVVGDSDDWGVYGQGTIGVYGYGNVGVVGESAGVKPASSRSRPTRAAWASRSSASRSSAAPAGRRSPRARRRSRSTSRARRRRATSSRCSGPSRPGAAIRAVVPSSGYFTVYLNTTTTANAFIHWFVIN